MLTLTCSDKQVDTQLSRHLANALLAALRRGPIFERPGTPWRATARAPNAPVNLAPSPVFADLQAVQARIDRLERRGEAGELDSGQKARLYRCLSERSRLIQSAKDAIHKEPDWPFVAGLYLICVPALRINAPCGQTRLEALTAARPLDMHDDHPLWPALSAVLNRNPRGAHLSPAPAFTPQRTSEGQALSRQQGIPAPLAEWLLTTVQELNLLTLDFAAGDFLGDAKDRRFEGEALVRAC